MEGTQDRPFRQALKHDAMFSQEEKRDMIDARADVPRDSFRIVLKSKHWGESSCLQ